MHALDDGRVGVGGRDDFEQVQVARRIEEVRAEPVARGTRRERPSASAAIGMPDVFELTIASARGRALDAREQRLLDVEPLDDGFDDPVAAARAAAGPRRSRRCVTSDGASGVKNGIGLQPLRRARVRRARRRA